MGPERSLQADGGVAAALSTAPRSRHERQPFRQQLLGCDLARQVKHALERAKLDPAYLRIEVTESLLMKSFDQAKVKFAELQANEIHFSIDDFGTGYSSLSYLHKLPFRELKIDRSFIAEMTTKPEITQIVRTIIALARTVGMKVVAEGIETREQLALLRALGCDYGQGFLLSVPLDNVDAAKLQAPAYAPSPATFCKVGLLAIE
jgi:EAL domain-containing protein (putative c-di-GMP-specific phosphodiesterase class I)